jgi:molybdenum cofactor guanylyltransferase
MMQKEITIGAAILSGGRGRRLGYPKELLSLNGRRVIDRILEVLRLFFSEIDIVSNSPLSLGQNGEMDIFPDLIPGCGPLGGIYTGLKKSSCDQVFFAGCDMPFLQPGLIERQIAIARTGRFDCVIPSGPKGIEPLHGIYSRSILPELEDLLREKKLSINKFCSRLNTCYLPAEPEELVSFFNINTIDDLTEAHRLDI